jgi:imidazolonepropionase-like amidohydrolase
VFLQQGNPCRIDNAMRGVWVQQLAAIRAAHRRGVKLLAGTDSTHECHFYGSSLHWELEHFVQAGIPPLEVLRIATQQAAEAVGAQDDLGTLEPGKLADIVLLDKNPLEDIRNTQTIWRVIKGGWLFDPEKLRPPASIAPINDASRAENMRFRHIPPAYRMGRRIHHFA